MTDAVGDEHRKFKQPHQQLHALRFHRAIEFAPDVLKRLF